MHCDTLKQDNDSTVRGDGGSRVGEVRAGTSSPIMAVATIEADEAVASSVFVQIMGTSLKKLLVRSILVIFGHFASSDFKVWLR